MTASALRSRPVAIGGAGAAFVAVAAAGVLVALAAAAGNDGFLVPALVRARASWLPGPLGGLSLPTSLDGVFAELAVMAAAYVAAVALAPRVALPVVLGVVAALEVIFLLAPPLFSTDVFNYVDVAQLGGRFGLDPYAAAPAAGPHTGLFVFLHWRHAVTVYGPAFTLATRALGTATVSHAVFAFKATGAAAAFGCTLVVASIAARRGRPAARAAAAFGLNPLVLVWTVGGGHNDTLMMLALLGGFALVERARPLAGAAAVVTGAAVKLSGGLAIPFVVLGAPRGQRLRAFAGAAGAAAILVALAYVAFPDHAAGMIGGLRHQQGLDGIASVPTEVAYLLGLPGITPAETAVFHAVLAVWLVACVVGLARGGDPLALAGWALLGVVAASSWLLPWYVVWPLGLAAAAGDRRLLIASSAIGVSYVIGHVPLS